MRLLKYGRTCADMGQKGRERKILICTISDKDIGHLNYSFYTNKSIRTIDNISLNISFLYAFHVQFQNKKTEEEKSLIELQDCISSFSWATVRILSYGYKNRKDVFNTFS